MLWITLSFLVVPTFFCLISHFLSNNNNIFPSFCVNSIEYLLAFSSSRSVVFLSYVLISNFMGSDLNSSIKVFVVQKCTLLILLCKLWLLLLDYDFKWLVKLIVKPNFCWSWLLNLSLVWQPFLQPFFFFSNSLSSTFPGWNIFARKSKTFSNFLTTRSPKNHFSETHFSQKTLFNCCQTGFCSLWIS